MGIRAPAYMNISNSDSGQAKGGNRFRLEQNLSFDILLDWTFYEQNNNPLFKISKIGKTYKIYLRITDKSF